MKGEPDKARGGGDQQGGASTGGLGGDGRGRTGRGEGPARAKKDRTKGGQHGPGKGAWVKKDRAGGSSTGALCTGFTLVGYYFKPYVQKVVII